MMTWNSLFFQSPSSSMLSLVCSLHDYACMVLVSILVGVAMMIVYTCLTSSFSKEFSEQDELESVWTVTPFLLLIFLALPSLKSIYYLDSCLFCGLNVMVIGHQWYWSYFIKDMDNACFDSYMQPSTVRLLDVDNRLILPCQVPLRFLVSSADVIHSWTLPSSGFKMDAVPGRLNQFCSIFKRSGVFFGQCSEICGANHSFMPIAVESIPLNPYIETL